MSSSVAVAARTFALDKSHSEVIFQVRHLVTRVRGRFSDFEGTIEFDESAPERSRVRFSAQAASVDTNESQRDQHLRSAEFFDVEQYPILTFSSTRIEPKGGDEYLVTGDLTIHGVTRPVTLPVSYLGKARDPWGNEKMGFEAETTINRKDFGLNWNAPLEVGGFLVGDEVKISLSLQAAPAK